MVFFSPSPGNAIDPCVGAIIPARILNNVDFPHPDGPRIVKNSPGATEKDIFFSTSIFVPSSALNEWLISITEIANSLFMRVVVAPLEEREPNKFIYSKEKEKKGNNAECEYL